MSSSSMQLHFGQRFSVIEQAISLRIQFSPGVERDKPGA